MDIIRSWREQKIMLKRMFPILHDEDFVYEEGKEESMFQRLEIKLGKTRAELESLLRQLQLY